MTQTQGDAAPPVTRRRRPRVRRVLAWGAVATTVAIVAPVAWVQLSGRADLHDAADAPERTVAMVLGAGLRPDGQPSTYLRRRLDVAVDLIERGVVAVVLVTGDSSRDGYDEPTAMTDYLVAAGVPADRIVQDYAGLDTHDSAVRAASVFGVRDAVVITQDYHLPRAVFSARQAGIDAVGIGVSSESVEPTKAAWYRVREGLASWRAAWDATSGREPARPWSDETPVDDVAAQAAPLS